MNHEVRFHIEMETEPVRAKGLAPDGFFPVGTSSANG
jgi:hypothetical protein